MESSNSTALLLESFRSQRLNNLTRINLDDLVSSFGWENRPLLAGMLRTLFTIPARKFARQMLDFDDTVGQFGLVDGARQAQRLYVRSLRLFSPPLPAGPFLALSNHPGTVDTLALFSALHRNDLKIIAVDRPFLKSLTNVTRSAGKRTPAFRRRDIDLPGREDRAGCKCLPRCSGSPTGLDRQRRDFHPHGAGDRHLASCGTRRDLGQSSPVPLDPIEENTR